MIVNYTVLFLTMFLLCSNKIQMQKEIIASNQEIIELLQQGNDTDRKLFTWYTVYSKFSKEKITPMSKVLGAHNATNKG
jgi:hypothetical protein